MFDKHDLIFRVRNLLIVALTLLSMLFSSNALYSLPEDYLVSEIQILKVSYELPSSFHDIIELQTFGDISFKNETNYTNVLLLFLNVFSNEHEFSGQTFSQELIKAAKDANINPCFIAALLASSYQPGISAETVNIAEIFGQDSNNILALSRLLKFSRVSKNSLDSEIFVAQFMVRYIALLNEVLAERNNLVALAWQLGFDNLVERLENPEKRVFKSSDLQSLQKAHRAYNLCTSQLNSAGVETSRARLGW